MYNQISEEGKRMLAYQEELARMHHYAPIPPSLFDGDVREKYRAALPPWCCIDGADMPLCSAAGTILCSGYRRVVLGDYGAYIEASPKQMLSDALQCKAGEEYRYQNERYAKNVKYLWLTAKDDSDCKIYLQRKTVAYADYIPGMYYVSPYEVFPVHPFNK